MIITLGQARKALAEFAGKSGKCPDNESVRLLIMEALQRLLHRGAHGNLRKWCFCLCNSCFTAPVDMEVPLKVKIEGLPEKVWSYWYEFFDIHHADLCDSSYQPGLFEEVDIYFTVYDIPSPGARIGVIPLDKENEDAYVLLQGLDLNGKEIYTTVNGERFHGEKIPINREKPVFSRNVFSKVTGVEKSQTCNYVRLYWQTYDPVGKKFLSRGLLSEYRPTDTYPSFRRFRVPAARQDCCVKISVLGRVKLMEMYHDNDILPVGNIAALRKMTQVIQAERNDKLDVATGHELGIERLLDDENQYYRTGGEPFDFFWPTSPGRNWNLI